MNRASIILVIVVATSSVWILQQRRLHEARLALDQARESEQLLYQRVAAAEAELESLARLQSEAKLNRDQTLADAAVIERRLAEKDPERFWVEPPAAWPSWEKDSPYVWMNKESLAALHPPVFTGRGTLRPEAAAVMTLDRDQIRVLNQVLPKILDEYRELEIKHAERLEEPLPGISDDGPHVTVRIPAFPDEALQLQRRFEDQLRHQLGDQRAELMLKAAEGWMKNQFIVEDEQSKTYSAVRHPDGSFNVTVQRPFGSKSVGGPMDIGQHIPRHLLPAFEDLRQPPPVEQLAEGAR